MNQLLNPQTTLLTMSSKEMAKLTDIRHDSVKRTINSLLEKGLLPKTQIVDGVKSANGVVEKIYYSDKRDSLVIVARLSPEFTARVVDRWQDLEDQNKPKVPQTYLESLKALIVVEEEKQRLEAQNNALMHVLKTYTTSELAKELGFSSANKLNAALHERGVQFKQNGTWLLYARYANLGLVEVKQGIADSGHVYYNSQWTQRGRDFVLALFNANYIAA